MKTHIVYMIARTGTRYTSEFMTETQAIRLAREVTDNGCTAEVFPADDRPMLFAWNHPAHSTVYRIENGQPYGLSGRITPGGH